MKFLSFCVVSAALLASPLAMADQPNMQAALGSLEQAKASLEKATADKGGHRQKAMQAIEHAMKEVKEGMEFDATHKGDAEKKPK
jgi:opacity protein-like surface antigen